jgi:pyruvate formate lyase activating enzyme
VITAPLLLEVKGNALDDGPGIRSVVFFKGCLLSCQWCHNPESIPQKVEISYDQSLCVDAQACLENCPEAALSKTNPLFIDREKCTLCFKCVEACPSTALTRVGEEATVDDIFDKVIKYKSFYETTGGGVTLSGGEPTLYMEFVSELLQKLQAEGIHTLLQTCGLFPYDRFMQLLYPYLDLIYFDIKIIDRDNHRRFCGVANDAILENFGRLQKEYERGGLEILARTPLVPGMTSDARNLEDIARFLQSHNVTRAQLMDYNPLWHDKSERLGSPIQVGDGDPLRQWMPQGEIERCREIFTAHGLELV